MLNRITYVNSLRYNHIYVNKTLIYNAALTVMNNDYQMYPISYPPDD